MINSFRKYKNNNLKSFKITVLLLLCLFCFSFESEGQVLESDSLALVDLYNNAGGENWTNSTNWLTGSFVTTWHGIRVVGGRVTEIKLNANNLVGTIPTSFNNLTALTKVWIYSNQLTEFPNLSNLLDLTDIRCYANELTTFGSLNNLPALTILRVENNLLTTLGTFENLPVLNYFNCSFNQLSSIDFVENFPTLTTLNFRDNNVENLPDISIFTNLSGLIFSNNQCVGTLDLTGLNNLESIDCANNQLSAILGLEILTDIELFSCKDNQLTQLGGLGSMVNLTELYCQNNQLSNLDGLENLTNLTDLDCSNNQLVSLPSLMGLTGLRFLDLRNNSLTSLPSFDNLNQLFYLDCSYNELETLPDLDMISGLLIMEVHHNQLTSLPDLSTHTGLDWLFCTNNRLTSLPNLNTLTSITQMYLDSNYLAFNALEPLIQHPNFGSFTDLRYAPQLITTTIDGPPVVYYDSLATLSTPLDASPSVQYQWMLENTPIAGETNTSYNFTVSKLSQAGNYQVALNHPVLTDLTINAEPHSLVINGIDSIGGIFIPNQLIVEYANEIAAAENLHLQYGATVVDSCDCTPLLEVWEFEDLLEEPITFADNTRSHDINEAKKKSQEENDSCLDHVDFNYITANNHTLQAISQNTITKTTHQQTSNNTNDSPIKVALIDSGFKNDILQTHNYQYTNWQTPADDDCSPNTFGYNFINGNAAADTLDNNLHASHMAAIMLNEAPENSIELMNLKAFGQDGGGLLFDGICAMHHTLKHDADIVNLSWSYYGLPATVVESALMRLQADSMLVFTSAGNGLFEDEINPPVGQNTKRKPFYPGAFDFDNMITVAAANGNQLAEFSNYSDSLVQVAAPGWSISPWDGATALSGSSQATAFATGMAAAYWYTHPDATPSEVKMALRQAVTPILSDSLEWNGKLESLSLAIQSEDVDCNTGYGSATALVQGGFMPYNYLWSTGATTASINDLTPGNHHLTLTDEVGLQQVFSFDIEPCMEDCPMTLAFSETVSSSTPTTVRAMNIISTSTIDAPTDMTYEATESISLEGGFTVNVGASFNAIIIANCDVLSDTEIEDRNNQSTPSTIENLKIYPNPAQHISTIAFDVHQAQIINLAIYDNMGRLIKPIFENQYIENRVQIPLDVSTWKNGLYHCVLWSEQFNQVEKILVLKP